MADLLNSFFKLGTWGNDYPTGGSATLTGRVAGANTTTPSIQPVSNTPVYYAPAGNPALPYTGPMPTPKAPAPTNSGGGGTTNPAPSNPNPPQPSSNDQEMQQVDSAYGSAMDYLNKAEQSIRGFQPQIEQAISSTYDLNSQLANTQKAQGERQIGTAQTDTESRLQSAISAARQALQESMMGSRQRFGGASNVTKALGEYGTTKFQQASGQARDTAEQTYRSLAEQTQQLNESFGGAIAQLNQWKQTQMMSAQQDFMSKLQQIDANRSEAAQNKSFQKIQLLQDMRSRADAIKNQAWTFQQNLELQRQSYSQQIGAQVKQFGTAATTGANNAATTGANGINSIDLNPITASQQTQTPTPTTQTGAITPTTTKNWWDQLTQTQY